MFQELLNSASLVKIERHTERCRRTELKVELDSINSQIILGNHNHGARCLLIGQMFQIDIPHY
jgi:uracil-DNA glycosylase